MRGVTGALIALLMLAGTSTAQTVSDLVAERLVMLDSHYNPDKGTITFIMGTVQGAPVYVCETKFRVPAANSPFDQCRKMN